MIVITIMDEKQAKTYKSTNGGITWMDDDEPPVYISVDSAAYPHETEELSYTYYNNSYKRVLTEEGFGMLMWVDDNWVASPVNDFLHTAEGLYVEPNGILTLNAHFRGVSLDSGKYKLIKRAWYVGETDKFIFEIEFNLF